MKKALWTLNINDYCPEMTAMSFPLMRKFAHKIGADFNVITEKKINGPHPGMEKFQLYELGRQYDWNIFFDTDTLIHPDFFDPTDLLTKDTTASYGTDFTPMRFRSDHYFLRDGRFIGKGNWCAVVSDWCLDYYHLPEDITVDEAVRNVFPLMQELTAPARITADHLVEDYLISRNIARFGLKHTLLEDLMKKHSRTLAYIPIRGLLPDGRVQVTFEGPLFHQYEMTLEQKLEAMKTTLTKWGLHVAAPVAIPAKIEEKPNIPDYIMDNGNSATFPGSNDCGSQGDPSVDLCFEGVKKCAHP